MPQIVPWFLFFFSIILSFDFFMYEKIKIYFRMAFGKLLFCSLEKYLINDKKKWISKSLFESESEISNADSNIKIYYLRFPDIRF